MDILPSKSIYSNIGLPQILGLYPSFRWTHVISWPFLCQVATFNQTTGFIHSLFQKMFAYSLIGKYAILMMKSTSWLEWIFKLILAITNSRQNLTPGGGRSPGNIMASSHSGNRLQLTPDRHTLSFVKNRKYFIFYQWLLH